VTNETIARNYAATLFDLAQRHDGLEVFADGMDTVVGLLDQNPSFRLFLETPRIADRDKKELLKKVFEGTLPRPLLNFLQVTVDTKGGNAFWASWERNSTPCWMSTWGERTSP
jgi:ATP synthase F1 delta subunit